MLLGEVLKNINKKHKKIRFSNIKFDSRDCKPNDLFFAISGNNSDGNRYIKNAIKFACIPVNALTFDVC